MFSVPARWPARRGKPPAPAPPFRRLAESAAMPRNLPSERPEREESLDLEYLFFLAVAGLVYFDDGGVGDLLQPLEGPLRVVLRDELLFLQAPQAVVRIAPDVAHRHSPFLDTAAHHLDQVASPLLGELRNRQ